MDRYVDTTIGQLAKVRVPCRLTKLEHMDHENRHRKYRFELGTNSEVRNKPYSKTFTGPVGTAAREDESTQATFFCKQAQNH